MSLALIIPELGPMDLLISGSGFHYSVPREEAIDGVMGLYAEADEWMRSCGIEPAAWHTWPLRELVEWRLEHGDAWLGVLNRELVCVIMMPGIDDGVWSDCPRLAQYVQGMAVKRSYAGHEIGDRLLLWATWTASTCQETAVRLDCDAHNAGLRGYFERKGFMHRGDVMLATGPVSRYERWVEPHRNHLTPEENAAFDRARDEKHARMALENDWPRRIPLAKPGGEA